MKVRLTKCLFLPARYSSNNYQRKLLPLRMVVWTTNRFDAVLQFDDINKCPKSQHQHQLRLENRERMKPANSGSLSRVANTLPRRVPEVKSFRRGLTSRGRRGPKEGLQPNAVNSNAVRVVLFFPALPLPGSIRPLDALLRVSIWSGERQGQRFCTLF